jgi:GNAT superfamily N-acetyltransferase
MWRLARPEDDDRLVDLCLGLYRDDPGPVPVTPEQMRTTLTTLRREPWRGRAVVAEEGGALVGYALLIAFWSNELGGEVCDVDELFVLPEHRGRGLATALFAAIDEDGLWPTPAVALALGTTPGNAAARRLYERLGFAPVGVSMVRRRAARSASR